MNRVKEMETKERKNQRAGMLMTLLGGIFWGFSGCCGQFMFQHHWVDAKWLVNMRLLLAGLILIIIGFIKDGRDQLQIWKKPRDVLRMALFAVCGVTMSQYTYFMTVQASNAGTATILQYLYPSMILMIVCAREMRIPKPSEAGAILLSLAGTFILGTHGDFTQLHLAKEALVYGLLSAVAGVLYTMLPGQLITGYGVCQVLGYGMVLGGILMLPVVQPWTYTICWTASLILSLAGAIILGSAGAYGLYLMGVSLIGPLKGGLIASVEPVAALVISVVWLKTKMEWMDVLGFFMIFVTVILLSLRKPETEK
ncbi:MAG: DMT family transporter [Lachnospiraceae bacterium]|nr:DMT family transporter [Lachnospiraceae bacterium]